MQKRERKKKMISKKIWMEKRKQMLMREKTDKEKNDYEKKALKVKEKTMQKQ